MASDFPRATTIIFFINYSAKDEVIANIVPLSEVIQR
jgi:hypothetical protein